jgi:hypothetical protein
MSKVIIKFKDPDVAHEITRGAHPVSEIAREKFSQKYFEWGEYGRIQIDTKTLAARLLPRSEWK